MLSFLERPPARDVADGLLVLHHGRGSDERDLLALGDALDPTRRLHVVTPRAPLALSGSPGHHWYLVPRVGYPDPESFRAARRQLGELHDELWAQTGIAPAKTILGGFSMGAVMSFTLALSADRPPPGGVLAFSGFIPTVPGWQPDTTSRATLRAFVAHGRRDPVIDVSFAREAVAQLERAGLQVEYHESDGAHHIDPRHIPPAVTWLTATLQAGGETLP